MKDRIKQIMEAQHMTQQVFAEFIGTTPATLSGIFNDRTRPTINIVEAIKKKIPAINTDWLLFGNGTMYKPTDGENPAGKPSYAGAADDAPTRQREGSLFGQSQMLDFDGSAVGGGQPVSGQPVSGLPMNGQPATPYTTHARAGYAEPMRDVEPRVVVERQQRRVTEIRVYYDDQTWESFVPSKK